MDTPIARNTNAPDFATAYYFLEGLNELGVDYLFCNFGTDHAPIIEEMAHRKKRGEPTPGVLHCPHENTAAHMAEGYAFVTGRGQGVLVHVDVGTANTANAMHNAYRSRLPVLLMAGKAPYTANDELIGSRDTYVHFVQEPFDQASLVRPYLKWEWTLPSGVVVKEALRRAVSVMQSEPCGPVYLMMQRETLTQPWAQCPGQSAGLRNDRRRTPLWPCSMTCTPSGGTVAQDADVGAHGPNFDGIHHIGFEVEDLDDATAKLEKAAGQQLTAKDGLDMEMAAGTHRNFEMKWAGPDGVVIDISHTGWDIGT